jgi:hypothetical protein
MLFVFSHFSRHFPAMRKMPDKLWQKILFALVAAGAVLAWIWFSSPPDPIYKGKQFSAYLYERQNPAFFKVGDLDTYSEALREKGIEAAPLLASWLEAEHPPLLLRLQDLLRKYRLKTQILPVDRQEIAFQTLGAVPLLGATRAIQSYLLTGNGPSIRQKAAVLFMWRFNSASSDAKKEVAAESAAFISGLLANFERHGQDEYALAIIGALLETKAVPVSDQLAERIRKATPKSRYLRRAEDALTRYAAKGSPFHRLLSQSCHNTGARFRRRYSSRMSWNLRLSLSFARFAQWNSVARIASPAGIMMKAGPGRTIMAIPASRTIPPAIPIKVFFATVLICWQTSSQSRKIQPKTG